MDKYMNVSNFVAIDVDQLKDSVLQNSPKFNKVTKYRSLDDPWESDEQLSFSVITGND